MYPVDTLISGPNPVFQDSELVLGLVAPVGTDLDRFQNMVNRCLTKLHYAEANVVRLSEVMARFVVPDDDDDDDPPGTTRETLRLRHSMRRGNHLRFTSRRDEVLALAAAKAINQARDDGGAMLRTVHVIRSLKHPDEVRALRRIYGAGFYLVGVTVAEQQRRKYLYDHRGCTDEEISALLLRDEHEEDPTFIDEQGRNYGQRTRDTFHLADAFVPLEAEAELERFLSLVFGAPHVTPSPDEHAMFLAFGAALRSGDLSRQVGAVIVDHSGDVIGVGANDVPQAGGGLYWPGPNDQRDAARGEDSNQARRNVIIDDLLDRLRPEEISRQTWIQSGRKKLAGALLMDITEYGRPVHAEMEALLACGRAGTSSRGGTLYCTTFPCHNCAKHIIDAGISRVVYVEPYPKSQAIELFSDSIALAPIVDDVAPRGENPAEPRRVVFEQFVGVGSRRFFDLFSLSLSSGHPIRRKRDGKKLPWELRDGVIRVPMLPNCYLDREVMASKELDEVLTTEEVTEVSS